MSSYARREIDTYERAGTSDTLWDKGLRHQPVWTPGRGKLVVVAPHPDDETLGAGGLLFICARLGIDILVISVTDGEASHSEWHGLTAVRRNELYRSLGILTGGSVEVVHLGVPDGMVQRHENFLECAIREHFVEKMTLVAPFERDGHPDHDCVGRICEKLAAAEDVTLIRYLIWAWHNSTPEALRTLRWGRFVLGADAYVAKMRAIECFKSQIESHFGSIVLGQHVLNYFRRPYEAFLL